MLSPVYYYEKYYGHRSLQLAIKETKYENLIQARVVHCLLNLLVSTGSQSEKMNALPMIVMQGQKDGSRVFHANDGYFYHLVNQRANRQYAYLRCTRYGRMASYCTGSARADFQRRLVVHLSPHNHERMVHFPGVAALRRAIVTRIKNGDHASNAQILYEEGQRFPFEVRAQLPLLAIESALNKIRSNIHPAVPDTLLELGYRLTEPRYWHITQCFGNNSMFAGICGSEADETLSLVFISEDMRAFMASRDLVFSDGTERKKFRKPRNSQIFSIYGVWGSHGIPMLRAVMSRRTTEAYIALFEFIKFLMPGFHPSMIMTDFEEAEQNAWAFCFPDAEVLGCLWHYCVADLRYCKVNLGLQPLVEAEEVVESIVRATTALPLLPIDQIEAGLYDLGQEALEAGWMPELRGLFEYLETEWLPKADILSVYDAPHRTNNVSETGNRALNKLLPTSRPGCFKVISAFVQLNETALTELEALRNGHRVVRRRKTSVLRNDRVIRTLCAELANGDITRLEFLHRGSRRMENVFRKVMNLHR